MDEYYTKPPVFKARQWDGTNENALEIAGEVKHHVGFVSCQVITHFDNEMVTNILHFNRLQGYIKNDLINDRMYVNDWIVLGPERTITILPPEIFEAKYYPKEDAT